MWPRSAPNSRANLRTDGLACAVENAFSSTTAERSRAACAGLGRVACALETADLAPAAEALGGAALGADAPAAEAGAALAGGAALGADADSAGEAAAAGLSAGEASAATDGSINKISEPSDTLSPVFNLTSAILPATGDGTSIAAFSVSIVTSGVSFSTCWPFLTSTSMTLTSLNPPISGTTTSMGLAMIA